MLERRRRWPTMDAVELIDETVDLGDHPGAPHPGGKALTAIMAMLAGAVCIDDVDVLRALEPRDCT